MSKTYGLVSVTFRKKSKAEIASLCVKAGLDSVEWGGDIHVPAGDLSAAREAAKITRESGLITSCYGSYFRISRDNPEDFEKVAATAAELSAPTIRVWCGSKNAVETSDAEKEALLSDCGKILDIAKKYGIYIYFECHRKSYTETKDGMSELFRTFNGRNLLSHWQPNPNITFEQNMDYIKSLSDISSAHVFEWLENESGRTVKLLSEGMDEWSKYSAALEERSHGGKLSLMLEFVKDESEESFFADAMALKML